MDKEIIKRIIVEKQNEIVGIEIIERNITLEPSANYIFVGFGSGCYDRYFYHPNCTFK